MELEDITNIEQFAEECRSIANQIATAESLTRIFGHCDVLRIQWGSEPTIQYAEKQSDSPVEIPIEAHNLLFDHLDEIRDLLVAMTLRIKSSLEAELAEKRVPNLTPETLVGELPR